MMRQGDLTLAALLLMGLIGCASLRPVPLAEVPVDRVWPSPPARARIRYLHTVSTPGDLRIAPGFWGKLWQALKGEKEARLLRPYGVEVDPQGRLFVVDTSLGLVHLFAPQESTYETFPKRGTSLISPIDVALDRNGLIYVSDSQAGVVKAFGDSGKRFIGEIGRGSLKRPTGLAVNPKTGELLVLDTLLGSIFRYDLKDHHLKGTIGKMGRGREEYFYPTNLFVSREGTIYVSDSLNFRIKVLSPEGELQELFGESGDGPGYFSSPKGVAADSEGHIYVVDGIFDNVQVFDRHGRLLMAFGSPGSGPGEFWLPSGIFIDERDIIYVADSYNQRIQVFRYLKGEGEGVP